LRLLQRPPLQQPQRQQMQSYYLLEVVLGEQVGHGEQVAALEVEVAA
jgi:hypothetical protein